MLMCVAAVLAVAFAHGGNHSTVARQQVDLIELNHFLDDTGRHVFDQLVFYEWSPQRSAFRVIAWRMVKRPEQWPVRTWAPVGYRCIWQDEGVLREIWSSAFRETWTQSDPERENRQFFSETRRPELALPAAAQAQRTRNTFVR